MQELIKIEQREGIETVSARELHEYLGVVTRFNDWIRARIERYDFKEGEDYIMVTEKIVSGNNATGNNYHISIDMAKELSMVENNEKGKEARRYFINRDKQLKAIQQINISELVAAEVKKQLNLMESTNFISAKSFSRDMKILEDNETNTILEYHGEKYIVYREAGGLWSIRHNWSRNYIKVSIASKYKALEYIKRYL